MMRVDNVFNDFNPKSKTIASPFEIISGVHTPNVQQCFPNLYIIETQLVKIELFKLTYFSLREKRNGCDECYAKSVTFPSHQMFQT